jgi:hypothetical protein
MLSIFTRHKGINSVTLHTGDVVALDDQLVGVPMPGGDITPAEKLGPGLVDRVTPEGSVGVRWVDAGFETWLQLEDLRPLGDGARLVTVKRCDSQGVYSLLRHKIAARLGLQHNWVAELRPQNLVRVLRDDGCAWTFTRNPIFNSINIGWLQPSDDDDAEALTAAEFAIAK